MSNGHKQGMRQEGSLRTLARGYDEVSTPFVTSPTFLQPGLLAFVEKWIKGRSVVISWVLTDRPETHAIGKVSLGTLRLCNKVNAFTI